MSTRRVTSRPLWGPQERGSPIWPVPKGPFHGSAFTQTSAQVKGVVVTAATTAIALTAATRQPSPTEVVVIRLRRRLGSGTRGRLPVRPLRETATVIIVLP